MTERARQPYWYEYGNDTNHVCEDYEILHGSDGFECVLTEPEDRWFGRDCAPMIKRLNEQHALLATATELVRDMQAMLEQLPTGIDTEADESDTSPEDMVAHIGGLMWKRLAAFLEGCR